MFNRKWEVYANIPQEEALNLLKKIMKKNGIHYEIEKLRPNVMYDAKNEQVLLKTNHFSINVIYVSNDPITRLFANLIGTARNFTGMSLFSVMYQKEHKAKISMIMKEFARLSPVSPWKITAYPRFRFAVLLQFITKQKWKRFLYQ